MVAVVPPFPGSDQGDEPVVTGVVWSSETATAPHVRCGVDEPSRVQAHDYTEEYSPQHKRNSADGKQQDSQHDHGNPVIVIQPDIEMMFCEIGRVF